MAKINKHKQTKDMSTFRMVQKVKLGQLGYNPGLWFHTMQKCDLGSQNLGQDPGNPRDQEPNEMVHLNEQFC
ncbi:UNVERIFIED_CONTAM: hypothetical protein FKN15_036792 [Acipenser sinensis]